MTNWASAILRGELHIFIAWDWGEEVRLADAQRLLPVESQVFPRHVPRAATSVTYSPPPLLVTLPKVPLYLVTLGEVEAFVEASVFDFGGVSLAFKIPFTGTPDQLLKLAQSLADEAALKAVARRAAEPLFHRLEKAIDRPLWSAVAEEYLVFQIYPESCPLNAAELVAGQPTWLSQLTRLETAELSPTEIKSILGSPLSYGPRDLFLPEWTAALLLDHDCEETLRTIEFTNLQLLEFRHLDQTLDERLGEAYRNIQPLARTRLPFFRPHNRPLRALGELRVSAHSLFDRAGNALKLVGDQYYARVYRLLAERFHLPEWSQSIERSLDTVESAYQVVSDQASMYRTEFLEVIVILLIFIEIVLTLVGH